MITAMDHDPIEFPDSWLRVLHPRRDGRQSWFHRITAEDRAAAARARIAVRDQIEDILTDPRSDPALVAKARSVEPSAASVGVRLAIDLHVHNQHSLRDRASVILADECMHDLGVAEGVAACIESHSQQVVHGHHFGRRGYAVVGLDSPAVHIEDPEKQFRVDLDLLAHPRRLLSVVDDATWRAAAERVLPYRSGLWSQRLATSYLFPDRGDWVTADLAELPPHTPYWVRDRLIAYSASEIGQLNGYFDCDLSELVTIIDRFGYACAPQILRCLDRWYPLVEQREVLLEVLTTLGSEEVLTGLAARISRPGVPAAFQAVAARRPEAALRALDERKDSLFTSALAPRLRVTVAKATGLHSESSALAVAPSDALPPFLASPPWVRPKPKPVEVIAPDPGVRIVWRDGERERWRGQDTPVHMLDHFDRLISESPDWARGYVDGSEAVVRPLLATWEAERFSFYLVRPRPLVGKYELDAYPAVLRLARAKPAVGAVLLAPYLSADVAALMAKWRATPRQYRDLATQWFGRHGADAVQLLLPAALGRPSADGRTATLALARLDPAVVRVAAQRLGCLVAVDALLARDPLDLIPATVPKIPSWLHIELLPPIVTRDGRHVLGPDEVTTLCRMIAMSQLAEPYAGLAVVSETFDASSLAGFAWALFAFWHLAERPSKDSWAMDALGYFGNDEVAARFAPLVRQWPSDGAAQRAKRGADVLGAMESPGALGQLSALSRSAKSTPLRKHAAEVLDRVASARGLLPEQLDDLLAPDLGLDDDVTYRGVTYRPRIGPKGELVLDLPDGGTTAVLPKAVDDEEKAVQAAWNKRRKSAKVQIADQVRRLEEAMTVQRRWTTTEFATSIVAHSLLGELARRLVWTVDGRPVAVDVLGDLVDLAGGLIADSGWIQVAHPATSDLTPWRDWQVRLGVTQPFPQIDRDVHDGDPSAFWGTVVGAASLHALTRRGWQWGPTGHAAVRHSMVRPIGADGTVHLHLEPGVSAVVNTASEPDQIVEGIELQSLTHGDLAVFGDLPRVTRSELLRDLGQLEQRSV